METNYESSFIYTTAIGSYITSALDTPSRPLKKLKLDDDIKEYLNTLDSNIKRLTLLNRNFKDMTEIVNFPNLIKLDISRTRIREITYIPQTVETFICCYNLLTKCPSLNKNIKILDLRNNLITDMPEFTPNLEIVNVDGNCIKFFRSFNHGLLYLFARFNSFLRLPFIPETVRVLKLDINRCLFYITNLYL